MVDVMCVNCGKTCLTEEACENNKLNIRIGNLLHRFNLDRADIKAGFNSDHIVTTIGVFREAEAIIKELLEYKFMYEGLNK